MFDQYHVCIVIAVVILGISKTKLCGGIGILAIPIMALVMPPSEMLAVMAVLLVIVDLFANLHYLGDYDWPVLKWMLPGAVFGVLLGCVALLLLRGSNPESFDRKLSFTIGAICLIFVLMQCYRLTGRSIPTLPANPASSAALGALAGGVSEISHSAGPLILLYLLKEKLDKRRLVGTMLSYTLLINAAKLLTYIAILHMVTMQTFRQSLWMIPFLPVGTLLGVWMNRRLPEKPFVTYHVATGAAAATAAQMIYKAFV